MDLGENGQPTLDQIEKSIVKLSNYVGVEFSGAYLSSENKEDGKIISVYLDEYGANGQYKENTYTSSHTSINYNKLKNPRMYTNTKFHTHPSMAYKWSDRISASPVDILAKSTNFYNFIILTASQVGTDIEKIDYTYE